MLILHFIFDPPWRRLFSIFSQGRPDKDVICDVYTPCMAFASDLEPNLLMFISLSLSTN
jgi:hypothetical protein